MENIIKSSIIDILKLYKIIKEEFSNSAILESLGDIHPDKSRYSIIGLSPLFILKGKKDKYVLLDLVNNVQKEVDWLNILEQWVDNKKGNDQIWQNGVIGYIGYSEKDKFEELDAIIHDEVELPSVFLVKYSIIFVFDRLNNTSFWFADGDANNALVISNIEEQYKICEFERSSGESNDAGFYLKSEIKQDFETFDYLKKIEKTIEYIKNGDIFQANITERFSAKYEGDPFCLYESLRISTPNPFFAYLDFDNPVISTSPERFFKISDQNIYANPIKGTVRCVKNGKDQREFLENSEKNRAENIMIVDLMRNDLGRVCVQGTVEVISLCEILKFNLLYHLESVIMGRLKNDVKISQILKATFPGGSITGAPKIRAMDIIEELESYSRGVYTGAIGFFGESGYVDLAIAIRVIYFDKDNLYFHAGGGIVVESEPEMEFRELMLKVESIKNTINKFGGGGA